MYGRDWERRYNRYLAGKLRSERLAASRELATHSKREWFAISLLFPWCVRCGDREADLEKDHIIPICHGGSDGIENLQPLCGRCNSAKMDMVDHRPADWRERMDALLDFAERP